MKEKLGQLLFCIIAKITWFKEAYIMIFLFTLEENYLCVLTTFAAADWTNSNSRHQEGDVDVYYIDVPDGNCILYFKKFYLKDAMW